jgi:hypothetical protein
LNTPSIAKITRATSAPDAEGIRRQPLSTF